jgi:hypothetical protein
MYAPAFLILFFWRKDTRKAMLIAGLSFGIVAFLTEPIFIKYYWHPEYIFPLFIKGIQIGSFEDFLYGFLKGGIAAVIYEEIFSQTVYKMRSHIHHWKRMIVPIYLGGIILFLLLTMSLNMNPIFASTFSCLFFMIYLLIYRRDLLTHAIYSGLIVALITYIGYLAVLAIYPGLIENWWKLDSLVGISFTGIPLEEVLEGFIVGVFGGVFYEFFNGLKFKQYNRE